MHRKFPILRTAAGACLAAAIALASPACGGGGGGPGPTGAGQGLVLVNFLQSAVDNMSLNTKLEFRFSEPVDPATVSPASFAAASGGALPSRTTVPAIFVPARTRISTPDTSESPTSRETGSLYPLLPVIIVVANAW